MLLNTYHISWLSLSLAYILLAFPLYIFWKYKTGLVKETLISFARMTLQLALVGLYLGLIFNLNNVWINIGWVFIMIGVATITTTQRSGLKGRAFFVPVSLALLVSIVLIDTFFLGAILQLENFFEARYFIPITGMIIGNCMERNIIALNTFYDTLTKEYEVYQYYIANGASRQEALRPFISEAIQKSFNPLIANTAVIGLIALPGMMTGQILGGSAPGLAIKYQILLMLGIFTASLSTVYITLRSVTPHLISASGILLSKQQVSNKTVK